ncbi:MAG: MFS transporter [Roseburia sp.]|nr:MFS transporter [Anaeroplasma bactoclasticum]MCM1196882.1 MFS transporter [Roseburia sp.]MCM1556969.1 MFS transporter [Anaeroplasma bactoclasticum]
MKNLTLCKALTFIRFFAEALFFPYISLYFSSKGLDVSQIGILIAAIPITAILCAPIYTKLCANPRKTKTILMVMSFIEAIFIIILTFTNHFVLSLLGIILISIISSSNYGMIDSLLTLIAKEEGKRYTSVRIYGSTSYMFGVLIAGVITKYFSYAVSFYVACVLFIIVSVLYFFIKAPKHLLEEKKKPKLKEIRTNKLFLGYVLFYVLFLGSMQVGDDFFSLYMESKGGGEYYNLVSFGFIGIEIITMLLLNIFGNKLGLKLFFVSSILLVFRNIAHGIEGTSLGFIIGFQMLRGVIWAIALYLSSSFVSEILGYKLASQGIIIVMLGVQIFSAVFKLSGGYIIETVGYSNFYFILFFFSFLAFVYFCFYYFAYKKYERRQKETLMSKVEL